MNFIKQIWNSKDLRKKILFTVGVLVFYRILTQISLPGVNLVNLQKIFEANQFLSLFSVLTGGSAENFSIILMGLSPYINASIIIQLLTVIVPKFESLSKEGDQGRRTLNSYTRWLTLPLAFLQSYGMIVLLNSQSQLPIIENLGDPMVILPIMLTVTAGTVLLMWLGELVTEIGIGNGTSIIILAGIIASLPAQIAQSLALSTSNSEQLIPLLIMFLVTLGLTILAILITEGVRKIPITYASRGAKGQMSNLPLRINQAGMIPIIFAVSVVAFPTILAQLAQQSTNPTLLAISEFIVSNLSVNSPAYLTIYFVLILAFTFFYVSITFKPEEVAENIQKRGGYVPGIRPGQPTAEFLHKVSNRLNLFGGFFLALIAILPVLIQNTFTSLNLGSAPILISGAGLIIITGVTLDLLRQINAQMIMHDYNKLI
ncbi:preprotein translocase subunit SecY [Candidatus Peregrinibacteria bacterium CG11_big_fil_rev_8_21_14_0_20_41_10]|nr:MAG: preprotein translocase subunit SecY [Candidatus Peregrinibacteria bacterium CG11_big_fil_rev_8_21_14_0_20_41_10]PJC37980.1 MAG: preprotein translocase subunit SecY [Candidatus Peregrinibacteria bacterium CG_4_9_14_0_2_um_filter_41_14]